MPVIPIPRRVRSFHGPHTTCMHSACGSTHTSKLVRTKYNNFDLYLRSRCMYSFLRFLLYFGCSLLTSLLWVSLSALFFLQYASIRVLLRLQYKLSVILLLLGHQRLDLGVLNDLIIYSMQITMFLVGGLGWCFMVFVDIFSLSGLPQHIPTVYRDGQQVNLARIFTPGVLPDRNPPHLSGLGKAQRVHWPRPRPPRQAQATQTPPCRSKPTPIPGPQIHQAPTPSGGSSK
ncbi:transmembrane protein 250 isoform 1-T2 [Pholidichthys leucotaenia]